MSDHGRSQPRVTQRALCRIVFLVFALALVTGTHWPALRIGGSIARPDLLIHVAAFGMWTALLMLCGFFGSPFSTRNVLISAGVAVVYAAIDELTQGIPILQRTVSMQDFLANVIGIGCATILAGLASLSIRRSGDLHGPMAWMLSLTIGLLFGGLLTIVIPPEYVDVMPPSVIESGGTDEALIGVPHASVHASDQPTVVPVIPLVLCAPFAALLLSIAMMPFINGKIWHKHFPDFAFFFSGITIGYYLIQFGTPYLHGMSYGTYHMLHTGIEYLSFIALVGGLYIVSGGIQIDVRGRGRPLTNTLLLAFGALIANVVGTTGASMLLIRPFMRLNAGRLRAVHVIFFIFIVSNCGGALTPIGDPPLYIGFLKGIPFLWTLENLWPMWAVCIGSLLLTFFLVDSQVARHEPDSAPSPSTFGVTIRGMIGLIGLAAIIGAVFLDPMLRSVWPSLEGIPIGPFVQIAIAVITYRLSAQSIRDANAFTFFPIKEVGLLFIGIFATMTPALGYLATHADQISLSTPGAFYFATGSLSSMLDNAPTYANFLQLAYGAEGMSREGLRAFVLSVDGARLTMAVSLGAVFFGALTYIGNGPNFMVKAIAEQSGVLMPSFFGYVIRSVLFLTPSLLLVWLIFLR